MPERVTITITGDAPVADVVARLEASGVHVEKVLDAVGVVIGTVEEGGIRLLAEIQGVGAVEKDRTVQLPPPDSDVQ